MGKLLAFYQTHLFTHMQIDRGPPGNRQSKMYKSSTIFILAYTIQFTKSRNKTYANTSQGVQLELAGGWLGPNMLRDLWGGTQTTHTKNLTSASSSTPLKRPNSKVWQSRLPYFVHSESQYPYELCIQWKNNMSINYLTPVLGAAPPRESGIRRRVHTLYGANAFT